MQIKRIVFLDFDEVLRTGRSIMGKYNTIDRIDPECIYEVNRIIKETGSNIVVSSSRRTNLRKTEQLIRSWGIMGKMIGITPRLGFAARGEEIKAWFELKKSKIISICKYRFVIIDDDNDMDDFEPYLVQCKFDYGLITELADKAIQMLVH